MGDSRPRPSARCASDGPPDGIGRPAGLGLDGTNSHTGAASIEELVSELGLPRAISVSARTWRAAAVLGKLRTLVNDRHRDSDRDRGRSKNLLNDLQGAIGEIVGLTLLDRRQLGAPAHGLLDLGSSVDRPDLSTVGPQPVHLDVKCHLHRDNKRLFLVNERARQRSIQRGVVAFLPLVAQALHQRAYLGRLVPAADLIQWRVGTLGGHRDPARHLPLTTFGCRYLPSSHPYQAEAAAAPWGLPAITEQELSVVTGQLDRHSLDELRIQGFSLDGLHANEIVEQLNGLVPDP